MGLLRIQSYKTEGEPMEDDFLISILDCLGGLERFLQLGLLDLTAIDIDEYVFIPPRPCVTRPAGR